MAKALTNKLSELEVLHLNALMRIFELEVFLDSERNKEDDCRWRLLTQQIFQPVPGEGLRQTTEITLYLGKPSEIPTKKDEDIIRDIVKRIQIELNKISKQLDLGAVIKTELLVIGRVQCRCLIDLNPDKIRSVLAYFDNLQQRVASSIQSDLIQSEYARAASDNLCLIIENITLLLMLKSYERAPLLN